MLEINNLTRRFGSLEVTRSVTLKLEKGARHALIGPNGAGKTTLINLLAGTLRPDSGQILLAGEDITALAPHLRVRRGLGRTHQINSLFPGLTPLEAVAMSIAQREGHALRFFGRNRLDAIIGEEAQALLASVGLASQATRTTRELPYGQQRLLEVALTLAGKPKVLLLDEPVAGVSAAASEQLFRLIDRLPKELAILLIEHDMRLVFSFAQRITVLVGGAVLMEGSAEEVAADQRVRAVYLGQRHAA